MLFSTNFSRPQALDDTHKLRNEDDDVEEEEEEEEEEGKDEDWSFATP